MATTKRCVRDVLQCQRLAISLLASCRTPAATSSVPLFLAPTFARPWLRGLDQQPRSRMQRRRRLHTEHSNPESFTTDDVASTQTPPLTARPLPLQCHGCGALSQTTAPGSAGYYDLGRKVVKQYQGSSTQGQGRSSSQDAIRETLGMLDVEALAKVGVDLGAILPEHFSPDSSEPSRQTSGIETENTPLCDRCHRLMYYHRGDSISHPSLDAIEETLQESPFKYNHVYHVIDAADFPMSLLPRIHSVLDSMPLRSKNRRSRDTKFHEGRKTEISFVISRADILAPKLEQANRLLPTLVMILRKALGRSGKDVRLGNVRLVSSRRDWWTKELREDVWDRRGGSWMVGKVNVGKSQLFSAIFPKGRNDLPSSSAEIVMASRKLPPRRRYSSEETVIESDAMEDMVLLPPARKETKYPLMPIVSALPGTTASPIRLPFGNGRGELIDLPGIARSDLENHVLPEHRSMLTLKRRVVPVQQNLKPGQSLLLGGLIRITPKTPGLTFLAYNFTALAPHLTSTDKAISVQAHTGEVQVDSIAAPGLADSVRLAGSYSLRCDVTKKYAGPITSKLGVNIDVERLPYRVLATDILIEGCGWVEIVAQVRTKDLYRERESERGTRLDETNQQMPFEEAFKPPHMVLEKDREELSWPVVEVYSPEGRFIGSRQTLSSWYDNKPLRKASARKSRPRQSMKGSKARAKIARRTTPGGS